MPLLSNKQNAVQPTSDLFRHVFQKELVDRYFLLILLMSSTDTGFYWLERREDEPVEAVAIVIETSLLEIPVTSEGS